MEPDKKSTRKSWPSRLWSWTGFGEQKLWDWLILLSALAIPAVLAVAGFWFSAQQDEREHEIEDQRVQDTALEAYLNEMSYLLLEKDLRESEEGSDVRRLADAHTLSALRRLEPSRKVEVVQFLIDAELAGGLPETRLSSSGQPTQILLPEQVVRLSGADLSGINLNGVEMSNTYLSHADLSDAELRNARLMSATLEGTDLSGADLRGALLFSAPSGPDTILSDANLSKANLSNADLSGADLKGADLSGAKGVTEAQLEEQAKTLESATMPDGSKHD